MSIDPNSPYRLGPLRNPYDCSGLENWNRIVEEARRKGIEEGKMLEAARQQMAKNNQPPPQEHTATSLLRSINDTLYRIEKALTMTGHKTRIKTGSTKTDANGKTRFVKADTAPPHVRAGRRRKRDKVTGARAAK